MDQHYTITDVLAIIKAQLDTIPVNGQHVRTMAAIMSNLESVIEATQKANNTENNAEEEAE